MMELGSLGTDFENGVSDSKDWVKIFLEVV
jgi:hypothetical protein